MLQVHGRKKKSACKISEVGRQELAENEKDKVGMRGRENAKGKRVIGKAWTP